jgi:hypothetical protein
VALADGLGLCKWSAPSVIGEKKKNHQNFG